MATGGNGHHGEHVASHAEAELRRELEAATILLPQEVEPLVLVLALPLNLATIRLVQEVKFAQDLQTFLTTMTDKIQKTRTAKSILKNHSYMNDLWMLSGL